jgi:hypothetical protein
LKSLTDPDSRAMAAYTKVGVGYNVQIAVDAKNKMIVEQAVTNDVLDMGLLQQTAEPARQILDVLVTTSAIGRQAERLRHAPACRGTAPQRIRRFRGEPMTKNHEENAANAWLLVDPGRQSSAFTICN